MPGDQQRRGRYSYTLGGKRWCGKKALQKNINSGSRRKKTLSERGGGKSRLRLAAKRSKDFNTKRVVKRKKTLEEIGAMLA